MNVMKVTLLLISIFCLFHAHASSVTSEELAKILREESISLKDKKTAYLKHRFGAAYERNIKNPDIVSKFLEGFEAAMEQHKSIDKTTKTDVAGFAIGGDIYQKLGVDEGYFDDMRNICKVTNQNNNSKIKDYMVAQYKKRMLEEGYEEYQFKNERYMNYDGSVDLSFVECTLSSKWEGGFAKKIFAEMGDNVILFKFMFEKGSGAIIKASLTQGIPSDSDELWESAKQQLIEKWSPVRATGRDSDRLRIHTGGDACTVSRYETILIIDCGQLNFLDFQIVLDRNQKFKNNLEAYLSSAIKESKGKLKKISSTELSL
jgi:hypothetical protein